MLALARTMTRSSVTAAHRLASLNRQMSSQQEQEPPVLFHSNLGTRTYTLNRPGKLNALNSEMLKLLRQKLQEWNSSDLCTTIVGRGQGRAFCAGGDVESVIRDAASPETRHRSVAFFEKEFELDYLLATLKKPYVAVMDGITMGGGVGLASGACVRIATEKTVYAMPETKIGYAPDVGAMYYLSRLDGEVGTWLGLTGETLRGRAVFEHGIATHYMESGRVPNFLEALSTLENSQEEPIDADTINRLTEQHSMEPTPTDSHTPLSSDVRVALDYAFRHNRVEDILKDLKLLQTDTNENISKWAESTLESLNKRSPTSLKVTLTGLRKGRKLDLYSAFNMELKIATAFCNGASPDMQTGVTHVLITKAKGAPSNWEPPTVEAVTTEIVDRFFNPTSPYIQNAPVISLANEDLEGRYSQYTLPSENEIRGMVRGDHDKGADMGITFKELESIFQRLTGGKLGVKEKLAEVVARKCEIVDNKDGNKVWLKWSPGKLPTKSSVLTRL